MKHMVLANANSRSNTGRKPARRRGFFVCVDNRGYEASLEMLKIYTTLPVTKGNIPGWIRVIDESREDYLFPAFRFVPIELPPKVRKAARAVAMT